jgi:hypothetical protein
MNAIASQRECSDASRAAGDSRNSKDQQNWGADIRQSAERFTTDSENNQLYQSNNRCINFFPL